MDVKLILLFSVALLLASNLKHSVQQPEILRKTINENEPEREEQKGKGTSSVFERSLVTMNERSNSFPEEQPAFETSGSRAHSSREQGVPAAAMGVDDARPETSPTASEGSAVQDAMGTMWTPVSAEHSYGSSSKPAADLNGDQSPSATATTTTPRASTVGAADARAASRGAGGDRSSRTSQMVGASDTGKSATPGVTESPRLSPAPTQSSSSAGETGHVMARTAAVDKAGPSKIAMSNATDDRTRGIRTLPEAWTAEQYGTCEASLTSCRVKDFIYCNHQRDGCYCDKACLVYDDCCEDFQQFCPVAHREALTQYSHLIPSQVTCQAESLAKLVSDCAAQSSSPHRDACLRGIRTDDQDYHPVTDKKSGLSFLNKHCALCNGANEGDLHIWSMTFFMPQEAHLMLTEPPRSQLLAEVFSQTLISIKAQEEGPWAWLPGNALYRRLCISTAVSSCPSGDQSLATACSGSLSYVAVEESQATTYYANRFCALCHGETNCQDASLSAVASKGSALSVQMDWREISQSRVSLTNARFHKGWHRITCSVQDDLLGHCDIVECWDDYEVEQGRCQLKSVLVSLIATVALSPASDALRASDTSTRNGGLGNVSATRSEENKDRSVPSPGRAADCDATGQVPGNAINRGSSLARVGGPTLLGPCGEAPGRQDSTDEDGTETGKFPLSTTDPQSRGGQASVDWTETLQSLVAVLLTSYPDSQLVSSDVEEPPPGDAFQAPKLLVNFTSRTSYPHFTTPKFTIILPSLITALQAAGVRGNATLCIDVETGRPPTQNCWFRGLLVVPGLVLVSSQTPGSVTSPPSPSSAELQEAVSSAWLLVLTAAVGLGLLW